VGGEGERPLSWLEITVHVDTVAADAVAARLFDLGCGGVVTEEASNPFVRAYLPGGSDPEQIRFLLQTFLDRLPVLFPGIERPTASFRNVPDRDWGLTWRRFFRPLRVTPRLWVVPAWEAMPDVPEGRVIRMDPGPAFGTGSHESTRLCLRAMERISMPDGWRMMDVGTGSGILAVYGAMLGASWVEAVDVDPDALAWAEKNLYLNPNPEKIHLSLKPIESYTERFDLVAANILLGVILDLLPQLARLVAPRGRLILSGLLKDQTEAALLKSSRLHLKHLETLEEGEWACLVLAFREQENKRAR